MALGLRNPGTMLKEELGEVTGWETSPRCRSAWFRRRGLRRADAADLPAGVRGISALLPPTAS